MGKPLSNGSLAISISPPTPTVSGTICPEPGNNYPADGLSFDSTTINIKNGKGKLKITGNEINCPRIYLDGQIYFVQYALTDSPTDYANTANDFISVHLRDYFPVPVKPKWSDIRDTMQQFSNLYPIMSKYLVDLGNRDAVLERAKILEFAFTQNIKSPMYMPVTRDLSEGKRLTIVKWLESGGKWDNSKSSGPTIVAQNAMKTMGELSKNNKDSAPDVATAPSELHQKLVAQMKIKMGENNSFIVIEDLTKL